MDSSTVAFGVAVNLLFIYYFGIYRGVFCVDLMSDRLSRYIAIVLYSGLVHYFYFEDSSSGLSAVFPLLPLGF